MKRNTSMFLSVAGVVSITLIMRAVSAATATSESVVDNSTLAGKVMAGYQAWFRCPGDAANVDWAHWFEKKTMCDPSTVHTDFWPDMSAYGSIRKYPAPGFTDAKGNPSYCYSACDPQVVQLHFEWMRDYDVDGAWVQHFAIGFPGQPGEAMYPSHMQVIQHVINAAAKTGRVWALSYDLAGAKGTPDEVFTRVTNNWRQMVDGGIATGPRYLRHNGMPVVNVWDFIHDARRPIDARQINRFIDYFHTPGKYQAFLVSGGNWNWHKYPVDWQECSKRFDAYIPWNIGHTFMNAHHESQANTTWWEEDKKYFEDNGALWIPTIYPGFSWNHLKKITDPSQTSTRPRRGGQFYWEQWLALKKLNVNTVFIAMFDEVDEGTAINKNTNDPPALYNGKPLDILPFQTYEGLPSDWYLRLTQAGRRLLRGEIAATTEIPIQEGATDHAH
ncbi:MAG: hypothetical protein NTW86_02655 [Candidatus Sumerlaeota bacterium]|nr:hypothetical protein [Candidatus Sumerlaeota bacterium]